MSCVFYQNFVYLKRNILKSLTMSNTIFEFLKKKKHPVLIDCPHCHHEMSIPASYVVSFACENCQKSIEPVFNPNNREKFEENRIPFYMQYQLLSMFIVAMLAISLMIVLPLDYLLYKYSLYPLAKMENNLLFLFIPAFILITTLGARYMRRF